MSELQATNHSTYENTTLTPIEVMLQIDGDGKVSARRTYEFLKLAEGQFSRWAKVNITDNEFAVVDEDFMRVDIDVETPTGGKVKYDDYKLSIPFAKKLCMKAGGERGEQARDYFVKVEEKHRDTMLALNAVSPELRLLINLEMEQKRQNDKLEAINQKVDDTRDIIALNPTSWRKDGTSLIAKIARSMGGNEYIRDVNAEIYKLVDARAGASLDTRLTNKRRRMADEGICKSARDKLNKLDVIADDKKLIEIYIAVVKDYAIKQGVACGNDAS